MAEFREERVTTERTDDGVVAGDPVRRGNPAPIIAAVCIGLLILFLVFFGMSRNGGDGGGDDDGVRVTVPNDVDDVDGDDGNDGGGSTDDGGDGGTNTTEAETDTTSGDTTGGTDNP